MNPQCIWRDGCATPGLCQGAECCQGIASNRPPHERVPIPLASKVRLSDLTVKAEDCYDPADYVLVHKDHLARLTRLREELGEIAHAEPALNSSSLRAMARDGFEESASETSVARTEEDTADLPLPLLEWVAERLANTTRIAMTKTGEDRASWIEDGRYWRLIYDRLTAETEGKPLTLGKLILDTARGDVRERRLSAEETRQVYESMGRCFVKRPLQFVKPATDSDWPQINDASGAVVARLFWPTHPAADTEAAEQELYAVGETMAAAASLPPFAWIACVNDLDGGGKVELGFVTLEQAHAAHEYLVASALKATVAPAAGLSPNRSPPLGTVAAGAPSGIEKQEPLT